MNRTATRRLRWALLGGLVLFPSLVKADAVPHVFSPGTRISSTEMNENFQYVLARIADKQDQIFGQTLRGIKHDGRALSIINEARYENDCNTQGGTAIYGETHSHFCGNRSHAGVHGASTASQFGVGVLGTAGNEAAGNAIGVLGMASGSNAAGLATWGSGLKLQGGGIRVDRNWSPMAFIHLASAENSQNNFTCIDQALTNDDAQAILTVTHRPKPLGYLAAPIGVQYDESSKKWCIHAEDGTTSLVGHAFNVIVVNTYSG